MPATDFDKCPSQSKFTTATSLQQMSMHAWNKQLDLQNLRQQEAGVHTVDRTSRARGRSVYRLPRMFCIASRASPDTCVTVRCSCDELMAADAIKYSA